METIYKKASENEVEIITTETITEGKQKKTTINSNIIPLFDLKKEKQIIINEQTAFTESLQPQYDNFAQRIAKIDEQIQAAENLGVLDTPPIINEESPIIT